MYTENDYLEVKLARKKLGIKLLIASLIFIVAIVICSIFRVSWPGYTVAVLWAIFVVFLWGMKGARLRKYHHFLKDIKEGLENSIKGTVERIDTSITTREMLDFYIIIFRPDDADTESPSRRLYYDASKGLPDFKEGSRLVLSMFGNHIKGIEKI